jgi:hypothetical protein
MISASPNPLRPIVTHAMCAQYDRTIPAAHPLRDDLESVRNGTWNFCFSGYNRAGLSFIHISDPLSYGLLD